MGESSSIRKISEVSEGAFAGEYHADSVLIAGFDEFWVFY